MTKHPDNTHSLVLLQFSRKSRTITASLGMVFEKKSPLKSVLSCYLETVDSHPLYLLILNPNTTIAEFANTVDPDETAQNEPSHQDPQCLPSSTLIYNIIQFELKVFRNFCRRNFVVCFFAAL